MANIVISNTGGFYSATTTWVGGVVPLATDTISATTTSGSLIVSDTRTNAGVDLQLYTSTLELRAELIVNGTLLRLGSGMTITAPIGSAGILSCRQATTLTSNGCVVPHFQFSLNTNGITRTLTDNWTITNFYGYIGNSNSITNGFAFNITNYILTTTGGGNLMRQNGTTQYRFNGANCSFNASGIDPQTTFHFIGNPIYIDTPGTFTITGYLPVNPYSTTGGLYYIQGTIAGNKRLMIGQPSLVLGGNTTYTLDVNGMGAWDDIQISTASVSNISTFNLLSNLNFTNLYFYPTTQNQQINIATPQTRQPVRFTGVGALKGGNIYSQSQAFYQTTGTYKVSVPIEIQLNTGVIHSAGYLGLVGAGAGTQFNPLSIRSISGGTQATLNLTGNTQGVFYTNFTDINASGGNTIYTYSGATSNTQNILTITSYVPTSSNTFLNG